MSDLSASFGVRLDDWQDLVLKSALGERSDSTWASKRVGLTVPRQNGKSQLMIARALAGVLLFDERKIVISAHEQSTARESFDKLLEIIEADENESLRARIRPNGIMQAFAREQVKFKNGAVIQFRTRTGSGGRGFSSDCLMLDEAQRLSQRAWVSINSTMSAMPNPQVWLLGTAPTPEDDGDVFTSIREAAHSGVSTASTWVEWGASPDDDPADEFTRWKANPAWNTRINHEVVQGEFETYTVEGFALDRLGIWLSDMPNVGGPLAPIWDGLSVDAAPDSDRLAYGVAFSPKGDRIAVAVAAMEGDSAHVEQLPLPEDIARYGLAPLADMFTVKVEGVARWRKASQIVISGRAGAGLLERLLIERGVSKRRILLPSTEQYLQSCGMLLDHARAGHLTHLSDGQEVLAASAKSAVQKERAGGWGWDAPDDETPVEAVSLALFGVKTGRPVSNGPRKAVIA